MVSPRQRIKEWLEDCPRDALEDIAAAVVCGLYITPEELLLEAGEDFPSGSDYIDHVGDALIASGVIDFIEGMQDE